MKTSRAVCLLLYRGRGEEAAGGAVRVWELLGAACFDPSESLLLGLKEDGILEVRLQPTSFSSQLCTIQAWVTSKPNYQNVPSSPRGLLFFKVGQGLQLSQSIWTDWRTVGTEMRRHRLQG